MLRVAQDARDLRLVDEHLDEVVVLGEVREHALDRDEVRRGRARRRSSRGRSPPCRRTRCDRAGGSGRAVEPFSPASSSVPRSVAPIKGVHVTPACDPPEIRYHPRMSRIALASPCSLAAALATVARRRLLEVRRRQHATPPRTATSRRPRAGAECAAEGPAPKGRQRTAGRRPTIPAQAGRGHSSSIDVPADAKAGAEAIAQAHASTPGDRATTSTPSTRPSSRSSRRRRDAREGRVQGRRPRQVEGRCRRRSTEQQLAFAVKLTPAARPAATRSTAAFKFARLRQGQLPPEEASTIAIAGRREVARRGRHARRESSTSMRWRTIPRW